ncbi:MAG: hypothetical protein JEZ08_04610 [Clostridiales bacterium]|nr:hypothetical protein [Clostridiales bacterium]
MEIKNNILRSHLQNVYWIGGTACAGKTTASKTIAEKYNYYHYDADTMFEEYRKLASEKDQPALSREFSSLNDYFERPIDEYIDYLEQMNREAFEMMIIDLVKLSIDKKVVVEGHYPPELMFDLAEKHRIAFLYAEEDIIRRDYFNRPDKLSMLKSIREASKSEDLVNHVLDVVVKNAEYQVKAGKACDFKFIKRDSNSTVENTLRILEEHFKLRE